MPNKALTIDVNPAAIPSGLVDNWSPLGNTTVFITLIPQHYNLTLFISS